ncbi:MAG TPA: oligosaccharide flippase family protein [Anaerolineales bacterium]
MRNSGYLFTGSTLSAAMSMLQGILAARLLGVQAFGVLGIITVFASVINRLTSFRMSELVVSYVGEFSSRKEPARAAATIKSAAVAEAVSSVLAFALIGLLAPLGARYLAHDPSTVGLFSLYGSMVLAHLVVETSTGVLQYFDEFRLQAWVQVGQSGLTLALILAAVVAKAGLAAVVWAYLLGKVAWAIAITVSAWLAARRRWGPGWWRAPLSSIRDERRGMARFALSTNLTGTLTLVTRDSEVLWLGALTSPLQVGYYKVALAILNIVLIPVQPLISTTYREVAREVATRSWENVRYLLRSGSLIAASYSLAAAGGLAVFGAWIVSLWGPEFLPQSYWALLVLLPGVIVVSIFYWNRSVLLPLGLPEYPTKVTLAAALAKVVLIFLLVPRLGAVGMAISLGSFFIGTAALMVWKTLRVIRRKAALSTA